MDVFEIRRFAKAVIDTVGQQMYGLDRVLKICLAALFSGGHVLLEGNPGVGKTELVKNLANALKFDWGRIQFTPDLMPADITGTLMPKGRDVLEFERGPIFSSFVLADEINRATPKTQSATLEAMAERKVTVLGKTMELPKPFFVMATQNPIEQEGTYELPEAQSDRFMFKQPVSSPDDRDVMLDIVAKRAGARSRPPSKPKPPGDASELPADQKEAIARYDEVRDAIRGAAPLGVLEDHVINLYMATNGHFGSLYKVMDRKRVEEVASQFQFGISPRAAGELMLAAKAWMCLYDGDGAYASAPHLAAVVQPALRHRLRLSLDSEAALEGEKAIATVERLVLQLCKLTAPAGTEEYAAYWRRLD